MSFSWANPYPTVRTPVFARNVVSTSQPLAAQAGLRILQSGGNAVDAAIAAAAVITMTEPCSNGLGADNFAIVWDPESRQLHGLNSSGTAPAAWTPEYFSPQVSRAIDTSARLGRRDSSRRCRRMVIAAWKVWQTHVCRRTRAGDRLRRARIRGQPDGAGQVDAGDAVAAGAAGLRRPLPAEGARARGRRTFRPRRRRAHVEARRRLPWRGVLQR